MISILKAQINCANLTLSSYIGIDISPDYINIAQNRLLDFEKERDIADEEMNLHVIRDPFKARKKRGTVSWPFAPGYMNGGEENGDSSQE